MPPASPSPSTAPKFPLPLAAPALSQDQIDQFVTQGYLHLKGAIPREVALEAVERQFAACGWDHRRPETWDHPEEMRRIGGQTSWPLRELAPSYVAAATALIGGADRLAENDWKLSDFMITNLKVGEGKPWAMPGPGQGWHKDGWFFRHFLDSPEQALLAIICWSDVVPQGGATGFAPESIREVARYLAAHPEGVHPNGFPWKEIMERCPKRLEAVGEAGDIILMHGYMLHTVAPNPNRRLRCIANGIVPLKAPMDFNRENPAEFSPLERTVLHALELERLDFKPTRKRLCSPDWSQLPPESEETD